MLTSNDPSHRKTQRGERCEEGEKNENVQTNETFAWYGSQTEQGETERKEREVRE